MVVNEAMCFGLPPLVFDQLGSTRDLVQDGYNGYFSPANNVDALGERIKAMANLSLQTFSGRLHFNKLIFRIYAIALKLARAAKLTRPLRRLIGPVAGRFVFRISTNANRPMWVHGHRMLLAAPGSYPPVAMATGKYEEETTRLFERILKPGMAVLDVGAHVGYYSLLAARHVGPTGKVYSFEPEADNYELLLKNIELNGYTNIHAVNSAISNLVGSRTLFLTSLDSGRHSTYRHGLQERGEVAVDTSTLDAFLESLGWPTVDLVKVDVEGAEMDVLAGMERLLGGANDLALILEFNPCLLQNAGVDPLKFLDQPISRHFRVSIIDDRQGIRPLGELDAPDLIAELLRNESSVNLYCSRG